MVIKYAAPFLDYSGYGETSRQHIAAFKAADVKVLGELLSYSSESADYSSLGPLMAEVRKNTGSYNIKVLHTTPDEFFRYIEPGKYHIGFCYWETDRIPQAFVDGLGLVDEIWTASEANKSAIRAAGVKAPIYIFPQPLETKREWPKPYVIPGFEGYLFYSIFEWTDRKNPEALIRAYLQEFKHQENTGLLLKTYFRNFSYSNKKMIRNKIGMIRAELGVTPEQAPIYLYLDLMDRQQVMRLHVTGDCFISTHRGEGWGLPQVEASLAGKPIISTGYGGCHEYFTDKDAYLIPYTMTPLKGMEHNQRFYNNSQQWADVDIKQVQKLMRKVYETKKPYTAKNIVVDKFNLKTVGNMMTDRLREI